MIGARSGAAGLAPPLAPAISIAETTAKCSTDRRAGCGELLGDGFAGFAARKWLGRWSRLPPSSVSTYDIHGGLEGVVIGGAAGLGHALSDDRGREGAPTAARRGGWRRRWSAGRRVRGASALVLS